MKETIRKRKNKLVKSTTLFMALFVTAIMLLGSVVPAAVHSNEPVNETIFAKPQNPVTIQMTTPSMAVLRSTSEQSVAMQVNTKGTMGFDEVILKYHNAGEEVENAIGFGGAQTWEGAIRFTPAELGDYDGYSLVAMNWYHYSEDGGADTGVIKIYDAGTATTPGDLLQTVPYENVPTGWIRIDLDEPIDLDVTKDIWISVELVQTAAGYPLGCDDGPMVSEKGGFLYYGGTWYQLTEFGLNYNWVIEGIIDELGAPAEHDMKMISIDAPVSGDAAEAITPKATVKNAGNNTETDVPVELVISTVTTVTETALDEQFEGDWPPDGWTLTQLQGAYGWERNDYWGRPNNAGTGYCAIADVDNAWSYPMECIMTSPAMDLSSYGTATVSWNSYLYKYNTCVFKVDISKDGSAWTNIYTETGTYIWGQFQAKSFNIDAFTGPGCETVQIRFHYYAQSWAYYWQVDDVLVVGEEVTVAPIYSDTYTIPSINAGEEMQVSFTSWNPPEWGDPAYEDSYVDYDVTAEVQLPGDENPDNDLKSTVATLYFGFIYDVMVETIISPTEDALGQTFDVKAKIKNVGQESVKDFFIQTLIGGIGISGTYLDEDWTGVGSYQAPPGWTDEHKATAYYYGWSISYSANSGGSSPEGMLPYWYAQANKKLISPAMDLSAESGAQLSFKSYINHFSGQGSYSLHAGVSTDNGATWTEIWTEEPGSSQQYLVEVGLPGGNAQTKIAFWVEGNVYYFNYWYLDDVLVQSTYVIPEYDWSQAVTTWFNPGDVRELTFEDWTPDHLATDISDVLKYGISVESQLSTDNNPANDMLGVSFELTYFHDVTIKKINSPAMGRGDKAEVIFSQPPYGSTDPWSAYTSDAGLGYLVQEDFYGLEESIGGAGWYGLILLWNNGWYPGDPEGMVFEVIFYEDSAGAPGAVVATFSDVQPDEYEDLGMYAGAYPAAGYKMDIPGGLTLETGWMSVQSTSSPSNSVFLWLNSPTGNTNARQAGANLFDNVAFNLTAGGEGPPPINVYVPKGNKDLEIIVNNVGTFHANDLVAYADIMEYIEDPINGSNVFSGNVPGINLAPLGDETTIDFGQYNFNIEGRYGLTYDIPHAPDDKPKNNVKILGIGCDATPPVSSYSISPASPDGLNGWYVSDVTVTLTATDPVVAEVSSGVQKIEYNVNNEGWKTYSSAFKVTTDNANHVVKYRAVDKVGNVEAEKTIPSFKIDKTKPNIVMEYTWEGSPLQGFQVTVTVTATDAMSDMAKVEFYFNEVLQETVSGAGPTYTWTYEYGYIPSVVLKAIAYDVAGNNDFKTIENPTSSNEYQQIQQQTTTPQLKIL